MAYNFHYTPTGTGVISGKEVLEQTEDAINDLGNTAISGVEEALDKAEQALTNSQNAVDDAQTALNTANNAEGVAIQAQNDVSNLSGTVTNIGNRVTTAEGNISNLQGRMTTAEGNVSNLQGRMTTAEGNIGNLQTAVSTAQATANSAQQTANTARQQSYVLRYASSAVTPNSTIAYSLLNNTDNIKMGDSLIDASGQVFLIVSVDSANQTVTVGSALIDIALDGNVVHTSGNEISTGFKQFANIRATNSIKGINLADTTTDLNNCYSAFDVESKGGNLQYYYCNTDSGTANISNLPEAKAFFLTSITTRLISNSLYVKQILTNSNNKTFVRFCNNNVWNSWVNETDSEYVHKSGNETVSGQKTFSSNVNVYNSDTSGTTANLCLRNQRVTKGDTSSGNQDIIFSDVSDKLIGRIRSNKISNGTSSLNFRAETVDTNNADVSTDVQILASQDGSKSLSPQGNNVIDLGRTLAKWKNIYVNQINSLTPSSLSMPSITETIDISAYVTDLTGVNVNTYTPLANGYIVITCDSNDVDYIKLSNNLDFVSIVDNTNNQFTSGILGVWQPCVAGVGTQIRIKSSALRTARFIPCQGNI